MVDKLSGFIKKRRSEKLYKQWVRMDGLPPEDVPQDSSSVRSTDESRDLGYMPEGDFYGATRRQNLDTRLVTVPIRYILLGSGLITILFVVIAILATILSMRGC